MNRVFLMISVFLFFSASAYGWEITAGPTYQDFELSGKVKSDGTEIDAESDLGISDDDPIGVNVRIDHNKHHLSFDYASFDFSAVKTLIRTIQFKNKNYNISTSVTSKVEYDLYEAQYYYDLLEFERDDWGFSLAPLLKVSIYDANLNLKSIANDEAYSETLPVPTLGLAGQIDITKYISLLAQGSGIAYSGDNYVEYKGVVRIKPMKYLSFDVGYKGAQLDYSDSNDLIDIDVEGVFLEGAFVYEF